ncbi:high mobility group protein Z [Yersinia pseudotuberculosis]|uniref:High mobility group protein Z n=1 Tax=Yersinia pseudotuberculosis TaxID=633 RepID=A0ABM7ANF0_YERPU|nr:high mobility group protein Z [Yersinia pseudotuberculosis]AYW98227.1 high mobility group protein Z [Yersinia pseudotuberculosis]PSH16000.1 high mobility group protein Z [Yersinia pseudotuberculosis]PST81365.1 high mobility group protein Z [Yersinia pseudotuberculosis]QES99794.1 high mobility group protein Z [Yersinia pseudotuberculosis]
MVPLIALLLSCYLLWLLGKLWRLSQRKSRLRSATAVRQQKHLPSNRPGRRKYRKE